MASVLLGSSLERAAQLAGQNEQREKCDDCPVQDLARTKWHSVAPVACRRFRRIFYWDCTTYFYSYNLCIKSLVMAVLIICEVR